MNRPLAVSCQPRSRESFPQAGRCTFRPPSATISRRRLHLLPDLIFRLVKKDNAPLVPIYLWQLLISDTQRRTIQSTASGAAGSMPNISKASLYKVEVPCPPISLQTEFAVIVKKVESIKSCLQKNLHEHERLFAVLTQQAFSGTLDLSRVVVPMTAEAKGEDNIIEAVENVTGDSAFELQMPTDLAKLTDTKGRKIVLNQWLAAFAQQLSDQDFATEDLINHVQLKLLELQSGQEVPNVAYEFSVTDYEHVKEWVFRNLYGTIGHQDDVQNRVSIFLTKD